MSVLRRAAFFRDDLAPLDGVACRMGGLFWLMAASRYKKRRPWTGETTPGGSVVAEERVRRNRRDNGGGRGGGGRKGALLEIYSSGGKWVGRAFVGVV